MRALFVVIPLFLAACSSCQAPRENAGQPPAGSPRITQFYAPPQVARGETANICYGVEGAQSVRIQPAVERLWPSFTRCFQGTPEKTTT